MSRPEPQRQIRLRATDRSLARRRRTRIRASRTRGTPGTTGRPGRRHLGVAVEVRAFLHDQRTRADLAGDAASWSNLDPALAVDLAIHLASDRHLRARETRRHMRLLLDDDRARAVDLALDGSQQPDLTLAPERALEVRALADQTLDVHTIGTHPARQARRWQADVHVGLQRTETRARRGNGRAGSGGRGAGGALSGFGGRGRRRGVVAVLRQRAAETRPLLFFRFLEHRAPPLRAERLGRRAPSAVYGPAQGAASGWTHPHPKTCNQSNALRSLLTRPRAALTIAHGGTSPYGCIRPGNRRRGWLASVRFQRLFAPRFHQAFGWRERRPGHPRRARREP